jgi:uncharacterized protein (TIGR03435 family)
MFQALLEDRFKLRAHRETREMAAYSLTVAKNGHKPAAPNEKGSIPKSTGDCTVSARDLAATWRASMDFILSVPACRLRH